MEREDLAGWLRLVLTPGIGNSTARRLLAAFGLPDSIFSQSRDALRQLLTEAQIRSLRSNRRSWPRSSPTVGTGCRIEQAPDAPQC